MMLIGEQIHECYVSCQKGFRGANKLLVPIVREAARKSTAKAHLKGEDFATGRTSNLEGEDIYRMYLPQGKNRLLNTIPTSSCQKMGLFQRERIKQKCLFYLLSIGQYRISGVLRYINY